MGAVVEVRGVVKRWGQTLALGGATCEVGPGVTGLLGANGAGKTSLLGLILGLDTPDEGDIRVFGIDPATAGPDVRALLGYSPEHHLLPPDVKAVDFVRHVAEVHGLPRREATNRASDVLWQVGLGEERGRPLGTMSTGQRQRVKLAQALAHDPHLVLLDEPTDGLDPMQRDAMLELIHRIGHEFGITVLLSSHL
ncbi:MAG: putative transporter ATP-binding protein, partial [Ilumatobacteraceae bacterium]|nr:putative transporter ATP-binding protein [Ilumatobacteraceae bacterium]